MLIIKFAIKQTRRSPPPRMAVVIAAAIFWLCQNSPSTNVQGCTLVDERAILAAENKRSFYVTARVKKEGVQALSLRLHKSTVKNVQGKYIF